jgi:hypothetical protein
MTRFVFLLTIFVCALPAPALWAQSAWQEAFAGMPLAERPAELDRHNCVRVMLNSFQSNAAVQALIFMPGATDEFYFFRRARARLTNQAPTLLDAVVALTNQTYVRATVVAPFLLLHTDEDPLDPVVVVADQRTADRVQRKKFEKHALYNDTPWDFFQPVLAFDLNVNISPRPGSHDSYHFFRNSFAAYGLGGWDALRAAALAGKTKVTIKKRWILFEGDARYRGKPAHLTDEFLRNQ